MIMAATIAALRSNKHYLRWNTIKALVHWFRIRHAMGLDLGSRLFTVDEMTRCRVELEIEEDSQPEIVLNKLEQFKPIN